MTATEIVHARLFELKTAHGKYPRSDPNASILKHRIDEAAEILSRLEKAGRAQRAIKEAHSGSS